MFTKFLVITTQISGNVTGASGTRTKAPFPKKWALTVLGIQRSAVRGQLQLDCFHDNNSQCTRKLETGNQQSQFLVSFVFNNFRM